MSNQEQENPKLISSNQETHEDNIVVQETYKPESESSIAIQPIPGTFSD
jgi:hypothetical protein